MRDKVYEAAMIAAMQALISSNQPGISSKYIAKKAQQHAEQLTLLQYGEYNPNPFPTKVL